MMRACILSIMILILVSDVVSSADDAQPADLAPLSHSEPEVRGQGLQQVPLWAVEPFVRLPPSSRPVFFTWQRFL